MTEKKENVRRTYHEELATTTIGFYHNREILDEIKERVKLTDILRDSSISWQGRTLQCLFHEDHNPSMAVYDNRGFFICFACGAKGDIFTLYRQLHKCSFRDAVKELGERAGVRTGGKMTPAEMDAMRERLRQRQEIDRKEKERKVRRNERFRKLHEEHRKALEDENELAEHLQWLENECQWRKALKDVDIEATWILLADAINRRTSAEHALDTEE